MFTARTLRRSIIIRSSPGTSLRKSMSPQHKKLIKMQYKAWNKLMLEESKCSRHLQKSPLGKPIRRETALIIRLNRIWCTKASYTPYYRKCRNEATYLFCSRSERTSKSKMNSCQASQTSMSTFPSTKACSWNQWAESPWKAVVKSRWTQEAHDINRPNYRRRPLGSVDLKTSGLRKWKSRLSQLKLLHKLWSERFKSECSRSKFQPSLMNQRPKAVHLKAPN